jgi:hypothetical protein
MPSPNHSWIAFFTVCLFVIVRAAHAEAPVSSDAELLASATAHSAADYLHLPLGDGHYVLDAPRKGYIYLCHIPQGEGGGAGSNGPWIHGDSWNPDEKIFVTGDQVWREAAFSMSAAQGLRSFAGNGLPLDHVTGLFPVQPSDPAFRYDRNPNAIQPQNYSDSISLSPLYTDPPYCMGMEVGVMLSGVPLFAGFDAELRDAAAHEVQDKCNGHPQKGGVYHYHSLSHCLKNADIHHVIGYALDGFPITGGEMAPGQFLMTRDLDVCHGVTSAITVDGQSVTTYHYVMTPDFPYSASCFRARPSRIGPSGGGPKGNVRNGGGPDGMQQPMQSQMQGRRGPPPEALAACANAGQDGACTFVSPQGDTINGQCLLVPEGSMACVPQRR